MKKLTSLILALILTLSLASCSGSDDNEKTSDTKFIPSTTTITGSNEEKDTEADVEKEDEITEEKTTTEEITEEETTSPETTESGVISIPDTENINTNNADIGATVAPFVSNDTSYLTDNLTIRPAYVYWQDGKLIAECYIINGFSHSVFNINVKEITLANSDGVIASGAGFGICNGLTLAPYTYARWTFTFSGDSVINYGADLSRLICDASTSNNY